jgi:3-oxoacyl-[acyl-carrier-protein] synthase-3
MNIGIQSIEYYLPNKILTNDSLKILHPEWDIDKVGEKSGVMQRHIALPDETAFDLACFAVEKLFQSGIESSIVDGIIFCTQSPDYIMPSNAFLIHKHFKFKSNVWVFDYNLACSGYIYGLSIARGMIESGMANNILLITADTYSKYINEKDRSTVVLFGDGASVSIVGKSKDSKFLDFSLATAGEEYQSFYIPSGGCRIPKSSSTKEIATDFSGNQRTLENIHMNGFSVWKFISKIVPEQIFEILKRNNLKVEDIDFWGFHQASKLTLDSLAKSLKINENSVFMNLENIGNTVSSSIPILLKDAIDKKKLKRGDLVVLSGFGVGLSWGTTILKF